MNLWKNLGEYGLQPLFHQNAAFNELIHKLYALSYVPPDQVIPLYKEHIIPEIEDKIDSDKDWSEQAEDLEEFGFYYENTWIEKRSGYRSPLFRLSFGTTIRPSLMTVWPQTTCWSPSTEPGTSWLESHQMCGS